MTKADQKDLIRLVGDISDDRIVEILALQPTVSEVEQAVLWAAGTGDDLARQGHPLAGVVAHIVDVLADDDEEPPPRR